MASAKKGRKNQSKPNDDDSGEVAPVQDIGGGGDNNNNNNRRSTVRRPSEPPPPPPPETETQFKMGNCKFDLPILSEEEADFFQKVSTGDTLGVQEFLGNHINININTRNRMGYTALHVAVRRQDEDMVDLLLKQNGILPFDTIFHAIKEENVPITKKLLEKYVKPPAPQPINVGPNKSWDGIIKSISFHLFNAHGGTTHTPPYDYDPAFHEVITPLMLAAHVGNTELIELFYERGERLEGTPPQGTDSEEGVIHHNVGCTCSLCVRVKGDADLTKAYKKYHLIKALSQPNYILFLARREKRDPVKYAIQKILKVRFIMRTDRAFTPFFEDFETRLEQFISKMLQCCRNTSEVEVFMCRKDNDKLERLHRKHPRLWYTVNLKLKDFVAQPNCQTLVYNLWAGDKWPQWESFGLGTRFGILLLYVVFYPITSIMNFLGSIPIGFKDIPVRRFMNYVGAYVYFFILVVLQANIPYQRCNNDTTWALIALSGGTPIKDDVCKNRGRPHVGTEWFIFAFVIGFFVSMFKRIRTGWYWSIFWNYLDLLSQLCFVITFTFWGYSWYKTAVLPADDDSVQKTHRWNWDPTCSELWSEAFIGLCVLLTTFRGMRLLLPLKNIGPLLIKLIFQVKDFSYTIGIIGIIIFAFSSGLMAIYVPYVSVWGHDLSDAKRFKTTKRILHSPFDTFVTLFFNLYGHGTPDLTKMLAFNKTNNNGPNSTEEPELIHHNISEWIGNLMFIAWTMIGSTMVFGMVTGYMSHRKEQYEKKIMEEWKFAKTELYLTFSKDTVVPPPLNLVTMLFTWACKSDHVTQEEERREKEKNYRSLMIKLMVRYQNMQEDEKGENLATKDDVKEIGEELAEIKALLKDNKRDDNNNNDDDDPITPSSSAPPQRQNPNTSKTTKRPSRTVSKPSLPPPPPPPPAPPGPPQERGAGPSNLAMRGAVSAGGSQKPNNAANQEDEGSSDSPETGISPATGQHEGKLSMEFYPEDYNDSGLKITTKCTNCSVRTTTSRMQSDQVCGNQGRQYLSSVANLSPKKMTTGIIDFTGRGNDETTENRAQTLRGSVENAYVGANSMSNFSGNRENQHVMQSRSANSMPNRDPRNETSTGSIGNTGFSRSGPDTVAAAECTGPEYSSTNLHISPTTKRGIGLYDGWDSIREFPNDSTVQPMPETRGQSATTAYRNPSQQASAAINVSEAAPRAGDSRLGYTETSGTSRIGGGVQFSDRLGTLSGSIDDERRHQTVSSSSRNTNPLTVEAGSRNSSRSKGQYSSQNTTFQPPPYVQSQPEADVGRSSKPSQVPSGLELLANKTSLHEYMSRWGPHSSADKNSASQSQRQTSPLSNYATQSQRQTSPLSNYATQSQRQTSPLSNYATQSQQQTSPLSNYASQSQRQTSPLSNYASQSQRQTSPLSNYASQSQRQTNPVSRVPSHQQSTYAQVASKSQNRSVQIQHGTSGTSGTEQRGQDQHRSNYSNTERRDHQGPGFPAEPTGSRNGPSQCHNGLGLSATEEWLRYNNYDDVDTVGARHGLGIIDVNRNLTKRYPSPPAMENIFRDMTLEQALNQPMFDSPTDLSGMNIRSVRRPQEGQAFSPSTNPSVVPSAIHNKPPISIVRLNVGSSDETGNATDGSSKAGTGISESLTPLKDGYRLKTDDSMQSTARY